MKENDIRFRYLSEDTGEDINGLSGVVSLSLIALDEGKPLYTSDIGSVKFITGDNDNIVNFTSIFNSKSKLLKFFFDKYSKYEIQFYITVTTQPTDEYQSFTKFFTYGFEWSEYLTSFRGFDWSEKSEYFYIPLISERTNDLKELVSKFKEAELNYQKAKIIYDSNVKNNPNITMEVGKSYEPNSFTKVITRMLEFQEGTLNHAIEYTNKIDLKPQKQYLITINNMINMLTSMYPDIDIKKGEGIPYNNKK
jgi:hypothetical protein